MTSERQTVLTPVINSISAVLATFVYTICTFFLLAFVLFLLNALFFQVARTRKLVEIRILYYGSPQPPRFGKTEVSSILSTSKAQSRKLDSDSGGFEERGSIQRSMSSLKKQVQFSPIKSTHTVPRTQTVMSELGYSETKV